MDPATETRRAELRALPGRRLTGRVMTYGDVAEIPGIGREKFASFAFSDYLRSGADTAVNLMHESDLVVASKRGGELDLIDSPTSLEMVATLPTGDAYDDGAGAGRRRLHHGPIGRVQRDNKNGALATLERSCARRSLDWASWIILLTIGNQASRFARAIEG